MDDQQDGNKQQDTSDKVEPVVEESPEPKIVERTDVFKVGDLVKVTTRDPKENKVHATPFEGIVISFRGVGDNKTFVVRRVGAMKVAIERIFPLNSPAIEKIHVIKSNHASRAKLYYLRKK